MYARATKPRHTGVSNIIWLILLAALGLAVWHVTTASIHFHYNNLFASEAAPTPTPQPAFIPLDVQGRWQAVLDQYPNIKVSIELRDIDSGLTASLETNTSFRAASTSKLITATYFLHQVEQGTFSLNQSLGNATASYQLNQMINQSNNDSWVAFLNLIGPNNEQSYARSVGLNSFDINNNYLDVADLTSLLQQLWQGKLLNPSNTQLLLSLMQNTNDETWIPPAIPADAIIYHKYGALEDDVHDASIIKSGGHVYALVIMTNGNGAYAYDTRAELFHALVKASFAANSQPN